MLNPKGNETFISKRPRTAQNASYRLIKSLIKAEDDEAIQESIEDMNTVYLREFENQEKNVTSALYICKKTSLEALKNYYDPYPLLFFRKKSLFMK